MNPRPRRLVSCGIAVAGLVVTASLSAHLAAAADPGSADGPGGAAAREGATSRKAPGSLLRPGALPRGAGPAVPAVAATTILDRSVRVRVAAAEVQLLGTSGEDYLAVVYPGGERGRVERITDGGRRTTVLPRFRGEMTLSRDGTQLFETVVAEDRPRSVVKVLDPVTGTLAARRTFRGYARVLDADAGRAVIGSAMPARALWWDIGSDTTRRIADRQAYLADIRADRVGIYTGDVRTGGCSVLRPLSSGGTLWRSCDQAVQAVSPDGRRVLARTLSLDGPLGTLEVRTDRGRRLATYRAPQGFGPSVWEARRTPLMTVWGKDRVALVRCTGSGTCERASALHRLPWA